MRIYKFEQAHPDFIPAFCGDDDITTCWEWDNVQVATASVNKMIVKGWVKKIFSSNSTKAYCLTDRGETLAKQLVGGKGDSPPRDVRTAAMDLPERFLEGVVGHDNIKWVLKRSLSAEKPVHVLLIGPPSTAKSMLLDEIHAGLGSYFTSGIALTSAGLTDMLIEEQPRLLIVDEIDKVKSWNDLAVLLVWMETGNIHVTKHNRNLHVNAPGRLFAAVNDTRNMPAPLLSRFLKIRISPYTDKELFMVIQFLLTREEVPANMRNTIIKQLWGLTKDPREYVRCARVCKVPEDVERFCQFFEGGINE